MSYANVSRSNIGTQPRDNIYELINTTVTDPKTETTSSSRKWIYARFPNTKARRKNTYPFIVLPYPAMDIDEKCLSHFKMMEFIISGTIYCEDNTPMRCLPQVTVIHNKDHMFIKAYYKKSERILKIKKIKSQLFNDRN